MIDEQNAVDSPKRGFATTQWSLVLAARTRDAEGSGEALARLCETYWYPLYAYVRSRVANVHEAQDFTQAFFVQLLEKNFIANADKDRGRFRVFLLMACKRFLINEWRKSCAVKRGGGRRPLSLDFDSVELKYSHVAVDAATAEQLYDQQWAVALLERTLERLRDDYCERDQLQQFEAFKPLLSGSTNKSDYLEAGRALGMSEAAAKVASHRMRKRYREFLRAEIADTVEGPQRIDDEIRDLFAALSKAN
jgi:DNA-directed RNA polymerase specialized sigma24 family protein